MFRLTRSFVTSSRRHASSLVSVRREGRIAVITLNDPERLNALNAQMGDEFVEVIRELSEGSDSENLGAVVLTGAGRAFSAGGDIGFLKDRSNDTPSRNSVIMRRFYERFLSMRKLPVPVIAAINGPAIGAGLALACAADLRVSSKNAKMGITFVSLGLHPGMGSTHFLPRLIGNQNAASLMLTGQIIDGTEAKRIGLVAEVKDSAEDCLSRAMEIATTISEVAPLAVRTCVRTLRLTQDEGLERSLWREADAQAQVWNSEDMTEGLNGIVEKRRPQFNDFESHQE